MTYVALMLLWCVATSSLHACNARSIGHKPNHMVAEKPKYQHSDESSNLKAASFMLSQESEALVKNGDGLTKPFSHAELLLSTESNNNNNKYALWVPKGKAIRSTLGVGFIPQATEEAVDSKQSETSVEDIVMMDYAQPHRKPPIHNEKP